eukprot:CAMPEP_0170554220 /NCGR_PEP_ID=MMETSP0211-20121228/12105_1 /TAXON_ID=311385 /ORGANISM="Pseudokeronopsis sp., Strain OXSARD2" /LENGTH=52 /DNA_ID=CAMNT_0010863147 /DNA_START=265 /DNA_END=423 /DNA_ORIENTATION=+
MNNLSPLLKTKKNPTSMTAMFKVSLSLTLANLFALFAMTKTMFNSLTEARNK